MVMLVKMIVNYHVFKFVGTLTIIVNVLLLFGAVLCDPGIHPKTYAHYSKLNYREKVEITSSDEDEDVNSEALMGTRRNMKKEKLQ